MRHVFALLFTAAVFCAPPALAERVTVFAAASLKSALDDAIGRFEGNVTVSYTATSSAARQIARGAPADIFLSASVDWMDWLADKGHIVPATRRVLAGNRLVIVASAGSPPITLADLPGHLGEGRLAMALVDAVPAGQYGKAALTASGLWQDLAGRVAQTDNVRAALALVANGFAPYGVVYETDANAERRVTIVATIPEDRHAPIEYPAALTYRGNAPAARSFLDYLSSLDVQDIFRRHGFVIK
jgi:molybdate transport system substrate-binding protein